MLNFCSLTPKIYFTDVVIQKKIFKFSIYLVPYFVFVILESKSTQNEILSPRIDLKSLYSSERLQFSIPCVLLWR